MDAAATRMRGERAAGIDEDGGADAGDQQCEDEAQAIDGEAEVELETRYPVDGEAQRMAGGDLRHEAAEGGKQAGRDDGENPAGGELIVIGDGGREGRDEERREQQQDGEGVEIEDQMAAPRDSPA